MQKSPILGSMVSLYLYGGFTSVIKNKPASKSPIKSTMLGIEQAARVNEILKNKGKQFPTVHANNGGV